MKLRARGPPRRPDGDADEYTEVVEVPSSRRRPARKSMAPRAAPEPTPVRSRPRTAPRGGVQKRKSVRPRAAAPTPSRSSRRTIRPPPESLPPAVANDHLEDVADGVAHEVDADAKVSDVKRELRVVKAAPVSGTTIDDLPEEVMRGIFSYFRPPQLCWKIGRVCRRWAAWSVAPLWWRGKEHMLSPDPDLSARRKGKA